MVIRKQPMAFTRMKRSRFAEEETIGISKGHDATISDADMCRKHGVDDATISKWKPRFGPSG
ncbi:hypothetical protein BST63_02835 [Bradyrhizobium canariense]|uniref:Transposase n=1 Tax=Bradyrhizobium canariense TaxID=255045 RepID=A0ABX3XAF1_9BRAD|nr:hypothetical protein BSR47_02880 [Bradyrhizobium canariense]OSJ34907.1 hypothetical protein BST63_02835 [Bradyrhizobium canariense]